MSLPCEDPCLLVETGVQVSEEEGLLPFENLAKDAVQRHHVGIGEGVSKRMANDAVVDEAGFTPDIVAFGRENNQRRAAVV